MLHQPAYRLRLYAEKSIDSTESTLLTPNGGGDEFLVSTLQEFTDGVGTWKPYLHTVMGRRGRIDPLQKRTDTGWLNVIIQDQRITPGGSNAERWVSQFVGGADGTLRLHGMKAYVEESLDGGSSWSSFFTGRIHRLEVNSRVKVTLVIREYGEEFDIYKVFATKPHSSVTYADTERLLPLGLPIQFGNEDAVPLLSASFVTPQPEFAGQTVQCAIDTNRLVERYAAANAVTTDWPNLFERRRSLIKYWTIGDATNDEIRVRMFVNRGSNSGSSGEYVFAGATFIGTRLNNFRIRELPEDDPLYIPLESASIGDGGVFYAYKNVSILDDEQKDKYTVLINDINPATLLVDLLEGKFGTLLGPNIPLPAGGSYGEPSWEFNYDSASLAALAARFNRNNTKARFIIDKAEKVGDFIEKSLCEPFNFCYFWNSDGEFTVKDLTRPTSSVGVPFITSSDLVATSAPQQKTNKKEAISRYYFTTYIDQPLEQQELDLSGNGPIEGASSLLLKQNTFKPIILLQKSLGVGENSYKLDAKGWRSLFNEQYETQEEAGEIIVQKQNYLTSLAKELATKELAPVFGYGPTYYTLDCRRTTNVNSCELGDLRVLQLPELVNPAINKRGGVRIARCISKEERGPTVTLEFLDLGSGSVAQNVNSAGTIYTASAEPYHTVRIDNVIPDTAGDRVGAYVAVTEKTVGTRPSENSDRWLFLGSRVLGSAGGSFLWREAPSGKRIWGAVQTISTEGDTLLASQKSYTSPQYVDTKVLPTPTSVATTAVYGGHADFEWSLTGDYMKGKVEVLLSTGTKPTQSEPVRIDVLPAGTTEYTLVGMQTSSNYTFAVRLIDPDGLGGVSPTGSYSFTTTGTLTQAPNIVEITVV